MQDKQKVTLYLPQGIHRQLKIRATVDQESMSALVERAIGFYLKYPEKIEEVNASPYGKLHYVNIYICPECDAAMVMRDGEIVSLKNQTIVLNFLPEQYNQLKRDADQLGSLSKTIERSINFYSKLQDKNINLDDHQQIIYDWLDKTSVNEVFGNDEQAWYIRGILLSSLKRYEEAISTFDMTLKLNPNHQKAWYKRGIAYYAIDFYEEAIKNFNKSLELDPNDYLSWYSLGKSWLELEDYKQAINNFEKVLELKKDFDLAKTAKKLAMFIQQQLSRENSNLDFSNLLYRLKVTLYLPKGIYRQLKIRAAIDTESMSTVVAKALMFYLKYPEKIGEIETSTYGKLHKVHICPECNAAMVMRDGEMVSLKNQPSIISDEFSTVSRKSPDTIQEQDLYEIEIIV